APCSTCTISSLLACSCGAAWWRPGIVTASPHRPSVSTSGLVITWVSCWRCGLLVAASWLAFRTTVPGPVMVDIPLTVTADAPLTLGRHHPKLHADPHLKLRRCRSPLALSTSPGTDPGQRVVGREPSRLDRPGGVRRVVRDRWGSH